jgi:ATP-dependent protease ClpP protease subunit
VGVVPNKDYRENPDRAVYVTGEIDRSLVDRLTPTINKLRLGNSDPITLYIDSVGGAIRCAEVIRRLIISENPDGKRCRLITVVTETAGSAAADLLALGDYAIAYPHASVLYHGSRLDAGSGVTAETATTLASGLQQTNEFFATRLASFAVGRLIFRLSQLHSEFVAFRDAGDRASGIKAFSSLIRTLSKEVTRQNVGLLREALRKQELSRELTLAVGKHFTRFKDSSKLSRGAWEAELLKGIINYKVRVHKNEPWRMSRAGLREISEDFELLYDFYYGSHRKSMKRLIEIHGELLLSSSERTEFEKLKSADEQKQLLKEQTESKLEHIWYFAVSLYRLLQSADYSLNPEEAYWLGLVDEVPGLGLPNNRILIEGSQEST